MSNNILEKDSGITLPQFCILKASAGSGKTHTLTKRYVQFLLSASIPNNSLKNLLAITFSNNAAMEMKERVLDWLKDLYWQDSSKTAEIMELVSVSREVIKGRAERILDTIFENYSDFQIKTIDSFMAAIFKASSLEFGYPPDFEILLNSSRTTLYAFELFLRRVREGSSEAGLLDNAVEMINANRAKKSSFNWNPSRPLLEEIIKINRKGVTNSSGYFESVEGELEIVKEEISASLKKLENIITLSGLERTKRNPAAKMYDLAANQQFVDMIGIGLKQMPVKKPLSKKSAVKENYRDIELEWEEVATLTGKFATLYSKAYYFPYLKVLNAFTETLDKVKKREGKVFIEDVTFKLSRFLKGDVVPDIYFQIGETIYHYLIDEFQDTSPVQWSNLLPLIENPLSRGGTLFAVGDTKQAIYRFRDADYKIMKRFETSNPFQSATHLVRELDTNYRSLPAIIEFNNKLFKEVLKSSRYAETASLSGLTEFIQKGSERDGAKGYVELTLLKKDPENPPEKERLKVIIDDLKNRGYAYSDITLLGQRNHEVALLSEWLDEFDFPFISHSSLDVRERKVVSEIIALLNFLNSPVDDFSFSMFCLGEIMKRSTSAQTIQNMGHFFFKNREKAPRYKVFQKEFKNLWFRFFKKLFKVAGHFPPYDLLSEIYRTFDLFSLFKEEEAALVKLLETVKDFENSETNSLIYFLKTAGLKENQELDWNISLPMDLNAIQVMTVHKSKGLGFPVVIFLAYGESNKGFDYISLEDESQTYLLKITGKMAESSPVLGMLYGAEKEMEEVSRMNRLYVALTRPRAELYIIGIQGRNDSFPFDELSKCPGQTGEKLISAKTIKNNTPVHAEIFYPMEHEPVVASKTAGNINIDEMERGEIFHKILFKVEIIDSSIKSRLTHTVLSVLDREGSTLSAENITKSMLTFITHKNIKSFFEACPERIIERETEYATADGDLLRMDRVVIDPGRVTVIDFKTGREDVDSEKYTLQIKQYLRVLAGIFENRKITGLIANIDTLSFKWIQ